MFDTYVQFGGQQFPYNAGVQQAGAFRLIHDSIVFFGSDELEFMGLKIWSSRLADKKPLLMLTGLVPLLTLKESSVLGFCG